MKSFWTDGSAMPNLGPGGFAVIDEATGTPVALGRGERTTNIRMEGMALIAAMNLAGNEPTKIHTDSEFWVKVMTEWAPTWERHNWKKGRKANEPIKNLEMVMEIWHLYQTHNIELEWVRGHTGKVLNERADKWANRARKGKTFENLPFQVDKQIVDNF